MQQQLTEGARGCGAAHRGGNELGAERDSLPRSEGGVWGVRRSTPQNKERRS